MYKYIITIAIAVLAFSCKNNQLESDKNITQIPTIITLTDAQLKNSKVSTAKIQKQNISTLLKVNGSIDVPPQNMVSISIPLGGYLKDTKLLPGMHIRKGECLAILEDQQYITLQQDFLIAESKLEFTKEDFIRQEELNRSKASSDKSFQLAKSDFETQKILLKSLSEKLKLIGINPENLNDKNISRSVAITSPIDGYVSKVNVNIGKYVTPSDILFELVNPTDIHLALNVFEKDMSKIFIGQKLVAYSNSNPDLKYPCEIILTGKNLSHERTAEVHCHFEKYDKSLIPGMYMNADIEINSDNSFVIASDAIVQYNGKQFVFIEVGKKTYEIREVKTMVSENGVTQVEFPNDYDMSIPIFVTKGAYTLLMMLRNKED